MNVLLAAVFAIAGDGPLEFAKAEIARSLGAAGLAARAGDVDVRLSSNGDLESYSVRTEGGKVRIEGGDAVGAMYGAIEWAERVRTVGQKAFAGEPIHATPWLKDRGWNVFLTLPWDYAKNDTDYDPAALTDPKRWWFANDDFWHMLLDEMARARLNWLDLHGTWDISRTDAPNLYAYFIQSEKYPKVGVAEEIKAANLRQLNRVIDMAHARGVRVSLMAYEARIGIPQNRTPPYTENELLDYEYTREVVEKMIRQSPGLDAIGFRIGESGHGESFFKCYQEAVKASGRDIPLLTRSWITRKASVVPLAAAASDFTVEIKYNGEQWGPPYIAMGGRTPGWYSYSFEDYLSDSGAGPFAKLWPGNLVGEELGDGRNRDRHVAATASQDGKHAGGDEPVPISSERWPSQPYKIVWQVRACGTHRIFPFFEPSWVRQSIRAMKIGTASGFTVEPINCYYPMQPAYYMADPQAAGYEWVPQRDIPFMRLWGRLGYDPRTPDEAFGPTMREMYGPQAEAVTRALTAASRIVPTALAATCLGPDHRNHAPELESGGDMAAFLDRQGYDSHVFMSGREALANGLMQGVDGRLNPYDAATMLEADVSEVRAAGLGTTASDDPVARRCNEVAHATRQLASLGAYYAARLRGGVELGACADAGVGFGDDFPNGLAAWARAATSAWNDLSESTDALYYRPFTERLRMGRNDFHWRLELPAIKAESERLSRDRKTIAPPNRDPNTLPPPTGSLTWTATDTEVQCTVQARELRRAWLLYKPLPSSTYFHKIPMRADASQGRATVTIPRLAAGYALAAEIENAARVWRIPSWRDGAPYRIVPSQQKPTPMYYNAAEALTYLKPESLTPEKHGMILVGSRAWTFFRHFDSPMQRKLLDAVERGMTLVIMQQDYTSGRYPLTWLGPNAPKVENARLKTFDPAGALGLGGIFIDDVVWQRFVPADAWEVLGNGGVVHAKRGAGDIWLMQARLMQNMHISAAAGVLWQLLRGGPAGKPIVLVDCDSEGGAMTTSVLPDFLNSHDIPFLTLGEVIAEQQGTDSVTPVPGRVDDDNVLAGRGPEMMKRWLENKVKTAAKVPTPASREEFDQRRARQKPELMRCLGLDPLPPRTPLNVQVTGTVERDEYRIEKLVYESRPGFFVTALLYVPKTAPSEPTTQVVASEGTQEGKPTTGVVGSDKPPKFPVIVNPHGHWGLKKAEPVVQSRLAFQAMHGYLAMVVDSPGWSFEGDNPIERRWEGTHDDLTLTMGVGNATGVYVWDLMRALDYLETRPEADMKHVGLTGTSGGGLATLYAFAADERFSVGIPVCYASAMEMQPVNGCLCNHVPGTVQVGDRSDVLGIRAPAPVMIIGATNDPEFPPNAMKRTGEKVRELWGVLGAADNTRCQLFEAGHGYDKAMREAAMGFFDLHLRGMGDGKPVPEPALKLCETAELRCMTGDPPAGAKTMRDLALERVKGATAKTFEEVVKLNGGLPKGGALNVKVVGTREGAEGKRVAFTFESEAGLTIPAVLHAPAKAATSVVVLISEKGKAAAPTEFGVEKLLKAGVACVCVDVRGTGELDAIEPRMMEYLGTAEAFAMGWDAARTVAALRELPAASGIAPNATIGVAGNGPRASQAAMFAALMWPSIAFVAGFDALREYQECFDNGVSVRAIQPRAADSARLSDLRAMVKQRAEWRFRGEAGDTVETLLKLVR